MPVQDTEEALESVRETGMVKEGAWVRVCRVFRLFEIGT